MADDDDDITFTIPHNLIFIILLKFEMIRNQISLLFYQFDFIFDFFFFRWNHIKIRNSINSSSRQNKMREKINERFFSIMQSICASAIIMVHYKIASIAPSIHLYVRFECKMQSHGWQQAIRENKCLCEREKSRNHNIPFEMMLISRIACQSAHGNRLLAGWLAVEHENIDWLLVVFVEMTDTNTLHIHGVASHGNTK